MYGQWDGQPLEPPANGLALFHEYRLNEGAIRALADGLFAEPVLPFWGEPGAVLDDSHMQVTPCPR